MPTIIEMKQKRAGLVDDARKIDAKARDEKRAMTAEESQTFDRMMDEVDSLEHEINEIETNQRRADRLAEAERRLSQTPGRITQAAGSNRSEDTPTELRWTNRFGHERVIEFSDTRRNGRDYRAGFAQFLRTGKFPSAIEGRALQADISTDGGYTVSPEQMSSMLLKSLDDITVIRALASVEVVSSANSLGVVSLDADPADAEWTAEIKTGGEDSSMKFGKRQLHPHPLAKRIKVSRTLIRRSMQNIEALISQRLAYKLGITEEKAFLTGTGNSQPLGLFTASDNGIPTTRDVSTDNTTTAITADGLINAKFSLKAQYQSSPTTRWIFHRDAVRNIRKLKDGEGQYLWRAGISEDIGDSILGIPVVMSEYAPNTFTTGQYVGLVGDMRFYQIADALNMELQVLAELYAETNQIGYIIRRESDGMPLLGEAFARVKLA